MSGAIELENYCYQDYLDISRHTKEYIELIDGKIYMLPESTFEHKKSINNIFFILKDLIKKRENIFYPKTIPYSLELFSAGNINIVQPDIMLFKENSSKPIMIFEVISDITAQKDMGIKKDLYEKFSIEEYFIVDNRQNIIDKYELIDGKYRYIKGFYQDEYIEINCIDDKILVKTIL